MVASPAMAHYHLDCSSGIAGDMFLGAALDVGLPLEILAETVARLGLPGVSVESRKTSRGGFTGTRFRVLITAVPWKGRTRRSGTAGTTTLITILTSMLTLTSILIPTIITTTIILIITTIPTIITTTSTAIRTSTRGGWRRSGS